MLAARSVLAGRILAVALFGVVLMSSTAVFGATTTYPGVYTAGSVEYSLLSESSFTDPLPLFGPPTVVGEETLRFESGMNFGAMASGAGGVDITDGKLYVKIKSINDARIGVVTVNELGGYVIAGAGGTSATQVSAACLGLSVAVNAVDGISVDGPVSIGQMTYHMINGDVSIPAEGDVPEGPGVTSLTFPIVTHGSGTWTGAYSISMESLLRGTQWEGHNITEATLTFDNLLIAQSETGTVAYIDKKRVWITPEPATIMLLGISGIGLVGYCWRTRRRRSPSTDVA